MIQYKHWIAHVDDPGKEPLEFHLNIPDGQDIPQVGQKVFASSDNGRTGTYRTISSEVKRAYFSAEDIAFKCDPFVSIDYVSDYEVI